MNLTIGNERDRVSWRVDLTRHAIVVLKIIQTSPGVWRFDAGRFPPRRGEPLWVRHR